MDKVNQTPKMIYLKICPGHSKIFWAFEGCLEIVFYSTMWIIEALSEFLYWTVSEIGPILPSQWTLLAIQ